MQAGLSWRTVLEKREAMRAAFDGFDPARIARYTDEKKAELLQNPGIIRNRLKVGALVTNARAFLAVQKEFGSFDNYLWRFVGGEPVDNNLQSAEDFPATSPVSDALSKDLKQRGFKFVGSTIIYSFMQAAGMVNDHLVSCDFH